MASFRIFDIAGAALSAQSVRLNVTASNLANAEVVSGSPDQVYRARQPLFASVLQDATDGTAGVRIAGITESQAEPLRRYEPGNPLADPEGYVYQSNVDPIEEMVNMISASRSYEAAIEVLDTSKDLLIRTLSLGQ